MEEKLRYGWTTGACATAAARAAVRCLRFGRVDISSIIIDLPSRTGVEFILQSCILVSECCAEASVIKDAGDDPDVTHGAEIVVRVCLEGDSLSFHAGEGVGVVTKAGLPLLVGEPAINPKPREMIEHNMELERGSLVGGFSVTISVVDGCRLAESTWNGRLGIVGGLSILGTSGIVVPYSCSAWIHSIHRGVDVARAGSVEHLGAAVGKQSDLALRRYYGLSEGDILDMGDFVGGVLKYLRRYPVQRLSIAGGFGKMSKLAEGAMDLHVNRSQVDFVRLGERVYGLSGDASLRLLIEGANSALEVLGLCRERDIAIADEIAFAARCQAQAFVGAGVMVSVMVVDRDSEILALSEGVE